MLQQKILQILQQKVNKKKRYYTFAKIAHKFQSHFQGVQRQMTELKLASQSQFLFFLFFSFFSSFFCASSNSEEQKGWEQQMWQKLTKTRPMATTLTPIRGWRWRTPMITTPRTTKLEQAGQLTTIPIMNSKIVKYFSQMHGYIYLCSINLCVFLFMVAFVGVIWFMIFSQTFHNL